MSGHHESTTTTTMPHLSQDIIIVQILTRLPVKSLILFRCVSKQWRRSISDPQFIKKHLNRSKDEHRNQRLVLTNESSLWSIAYNNDDDIDDDRAAAVRLDLSFVVNNSPRKCFVSVLCSCNGLLCLNIEENALCLWNPSTGEYRNILSPGKFPNASSVAIYGLGYDSSIDDYKLVRALFTRGVADEMEMSVLSLKTDDFWRLIGTYPYN